MNTTEDIVEMARKLFAALVRKSADVRMNVQNESAQTVIFTVSGDPEDVPRIVGQRGAHFLSVKSLVEIACSTNRTKKIVLYKVEEPPVRIMKPWQRFEYNPKWPRREIQELLARTLTIVLGCHDVTVKADEGTGTHCLMTVDVIGGHREHIAVVSEACNKIFSSIGVTHGIGLTIEIG